MAVSSFRKALHRGYLKGFTIWLELEIGIMPEFWIYQGSEYARVPNMPGLHYGDTGVYAGFGISLNMPE